MAETIYLKDGKTEVVFDLEKTLCEIALEYCGEDYEREIRKLFRNDNLKERLQEIKEAIDDIDDLASDVRDWIDSIKDGD
ncbi:MAG: hypothetical protein RR370_03670 [Synergistaceae bacterium]